MGELEQENLRGFIFKSKSPSSGMERVRVYNEPPRASPVTRGVGLFARIFMAHFPLLPVEEEGRLHDPVLRENFIERLFVLQRWRELLAAGPNLRDLVAFHTRHKLLILAHSPNHYRELGRLVARAKEVPVQELCEHYLSRLMEALRLKTTPKKNTNVLSHLMGYFKKDLTPDEKQELLEVIDSSTEAASPGGAHHLDQSLCPEISSALPARTGLPPPPSRGIPTARPRVIADGGKGGTGVPPELNAGPSLCG